MQSFAIQVYNLGNRMNASAIKDLFTLRVRFENSKLHEPLSECNLKEFSNIRRSVNL